MDLVAHLDPGVVTSSPSQIISISTANNHPVIPSKVLKSTRRYPKTPLQPKIYMVHPFLDIPAPGADAATKTATPSAPAPLPPRCDPGDL